jgi:hypothetical protein
MLNKTVHKAVSTLIIQYQEKTHNSFNIRCPLCKIFIGSKGCQQCPNGAFDGKFVALCRNRSVTFPKLAYFDNDCFVDLANYWLDVIKLIPNNNKKYYMNKKTKELILNIANKYQ